MVKVAVASSLAPADTLMFRELPSVVAVIPFASPDTLQLSAFKFESLRESGKTLFSPGLSVTEGSTFTVTLSSASAVGSIPATRQRHRRTDKRRDSGFRFMI
ncbi:MAG TPA: hypothetical protein H9701_07160, partial [Candidatus Intestinimonas pullistercoris]|nr:hypothetical protein [Candidatus Intestinimonas pullistercoris]